MIERSMPVRIRNRGLDALSGLADPEHSMTMLEYLQEPPAKFSPSTIERQSGTPAEEQEGYGLIGRIRRMSASEYGEQRMTRTLREVAHPKVRGAALWAAHAFMATCHIAASDRRSGTTTQDRQAAWLSRSSPAARQWLALRQKSWPPS